MRECLHFLECVRYGKMPRTDAYEGIRVLEVLTRSESALKGAPREQSHRQVGSAQIHETAIVDEGCSIGSGTKIWHFSHILSGSNIGRNCVIGQNVMIGPDVIVGDGCKIQNNVSLYKGVKLGNAVFVGPSAVFTNVNTPRADIERKSEFLETIVEDGATIGANATIVCGHRLGARSFVAAGSVVTRDVPPHDDEIVRIDLRRQIRRLFQIDAIGNVDNLVAGSATGGDVVERIRQQCYDCIGFRV